MEITLAHERGQDASDYLIALQKLKDKMNGPGDSMYVAYQDLQKINADTFKQIDQAFANLIVDGGKFSDAMIAVGKTIAKEFIDDVLQISLEPLSRRP